MNNDLLLSGKYTFRAHQHKLVVVKKPVESLRHVVMKALLWALYLPAYPRVRVEVPIGYKYKPDLVQIGPQGPEFWAEAGRIGARKLAQVLKRFPQTHFAMAVWGASPAPLQHRISRRLRRTARFAPIDVIGFPADADRQYITPRGSIHIHHDDLDWQRLQ
jgi:hypothetical protein